ncbi:MAG: hypothetical protein ACREUL_13890 [Steroidobacteraceae bacterium]
MSESSVAEQSQGAVARGQCLCGEPARAGHMSIWAGTLDAPTGLRPAMDIFVAEKGDYYEITDGLPQWPRWPEHRQDD